MWDCLVCKCKAIASSLLNCPVCKEDRVPKTTAEGGGSNADALPGEPGYIAPDPVPVADAEAGPEPVEAVADAGGPAAAAEPAKAEPEPPAAQEPEPPAAPEPKAEPAPAPPASVPLKKLGASGG